MGTLGNGAPRIYLAGPEVFMPEVTRLAAEKCALAASYGFIGVFPLDNSLQLDRLTKHERAARIAAGNEDLMRGCDGLIANVTPFRGVSMDSGTAFEVGFMRAMGKPVAGYSSVIEDYAARTAYYRSFGCLPFDADRPEYEVEDFDLPENLMITSAFEASGFDTAVGGDGLASLAALGGYERCLQQLQEHFVKHGRI